MRNKKLIILFFIILFLAVLVVLDSVLFSVKKVTAYCHNDVDNVIQADATTLSQKVIDGSKIKSGKSIFLLNKDKVIKNVQKNVSDVRVINIEKKFPNRVTIHYAAIKPTFNVRFSDGFYIVNNEGKITEISQQRRDGLIDLIAEVEDGLQVGDKIRCENLNSVFDIMDALDRLGYSAEDQHERILLLSLISFIDLTVHSEIIYIGTSGDIDIKILGIASDTIFKKIHYGLSLYVNFRSNKVEGMITVSDSNVFTWNDNSDYYSR